MRDTIFISHANPENNFFATWLATKLRLCGYKVWVDVGDIKPGQYFNRDFEKTIKEETIRFLAVVSNEYIIKSKRPDSGVMNEVLCARTVKEIDGFIIPLQYDDTNFDDYTVGLIGRLALPFNHNWADGLHELLKFLEDIKIPKSDSNNNILQFWHEAQKIKSEPINKEEKYFSNWFPIKLPENIFIHFPENLNEKDFLSMPYSYIREGNRLISLVSPETFQGYTKLFSTTIFPIKDLFTYDPIKVDEKFILNEPNKKLIKLLNKEFRSHLVRKKLRIYEQSKRREVFHFSYSTDNKKMVSLKQIGKSRRSILGTTNEFSWYFALSHSASTYPYPNYRIYYHLIFTDKNGKHLKSDEQQELRRSFPNDWYNRKWLETLLAMMVKISDYDLDNQIKIQVDVDKILSVSVLPIEIVSPIGYKEPTNEIDPSILP